MTISIFEFEFQICERESIMTSKHIPKLVLTLKRTINLTGSVRSVDIWEIFIYSSENIEIVTDSHFEVTENWTFAKINRQVIQITTASLIFVDSSSVDIDYNSWSKLINSETLNSFLKSINLEYLNRIFQFGNGGKMEHEFEWIKSLRWSCAVSSIRWPKYNS